MFQQGVCFAVAIFLFYFQLASFCWMLVEGINLLRGLVKVFRVTSRLKTYYLFAWGESFFLPFPMYKGIRIPESRKCLLVKSGIGGNFVRGILYFWALESEIQFNESGIPQTIRIQNPSSNQNPVQWNPVNTDAKVAIESVRINGVSVLSRLNLDKMYGLPFPKDKGNCP